MRVWMALNETPRSRTAARKAAPPEDDGPALNGYHRQSTSPLAGTCNGPSRGREIAQFSLL